MTKLCTLETGNKASIPTFTTHSVLYWWAYHCNRQEKGIKGIKIEKEEVKVFADDMITYVKKNLGNLQSNC